MSANLHRDDLLCIVKSERQLSTCLVHLCASWYNFLLPQFPPTNKSLCQDAPGRGNGEEGISHLFWRDDIESTCAQGGSDCWELEQILFRRILSRALLKLL